MKVMYEIGGKEESKFPADTDLLCHKLAVTAAVFRDTTKILTVDMTPRRMVGGY
jgi:hypothetical protein